MKGHWLVLYPRAWRERYGAEVAGLVDELISAGETTRRRAALDLVAGAAAERCRVVARRAVVLPVAIVCAVAGGVALAVTGARPGADATRPYYDTHPIGVLLLFAELGWLVMELAEGWRGRRSRRSPDRDARKQRRRFWLAVGACVVAVTATANLAPAVVPVAQIRPGLVAFALGMALLLAGIGLRGWSFAALRGRYLNFSVVVGSDQPLVTRGPYRLLQHPGNAGMLLICAGIGLASANWVGVAAMTLLPLAVVVWRIRAEEKLLLVVLGDPYRRYAADHKRLVPLIW